MNLSAFVGVQSLGLDMLTRSGSGIASVGLAVSLPIFNGGRLRSQLGQRARYDRGRGPVPQHLEPGLAGGGQTTRQASGRCSSS